MILVLDIDETLIHSIKHDPSIEVESNEVFHLHDFTVYKRPNMDIFLKNLLNDPYYEVAVWSAGSYPYVHSIVDNIIPDRSKLKFIMTKNDCNELYDKPLNKARELLNGNTEHPYSMHDILLIDNKRHVTGHDHLNHLKIIDYEGDPDDIELSLLWKHLDKYRYYSSEYIAIHWK